MLLAVQRDNLELSIKCGIQWTYHLLKQQNGSMETKIKTCIIAFPSLWYSWSDNLDLLSALSSSSTATDNLDLDALSSSSTATDNLWDLWALALSLSDSNVKQLFSKIQSFNSYVPLLLIHSLFY